MIRQVRLDPVDLEEAIIGDEDLANHDGRQKP